jgi:hypothetical protein
MYNKRHDHTRWGSVDRTLSGGSQHDTPLHTACFRGVLEDVLIIVDSGADMVGPWSTSPTTEGGNDMDHVVLLIVEAVVLDWEVLGHHRPCE